MTRAYQEGAYRSYWQTERPHLLEITFENSFARGSQFLFTKTPEVGTPQRKVNLIFYNSLPEVSGYVTIQQDEQRILSFDLEGTPQAGQPSLSDETQEMLREGGLLLQLWLDASLNNPSEVIEAHRELARRRTSGRMPQGVDSRMAMPSQENIEGTLAFLHKLLPPQPTN